MQEQVKTNMGPGIWHLPTWENSGTSTVGLIQLFLANMGLESR